MLKLFQSAHSRRFYSWYVNERIFKTKKSSARSSVISRGTVAFGNWQQQLRCPNSIWHHAKEYVEMFYLTEKKHISKAYFSIARENSHFTKHSRQNSRIALLYISTCRRHPVIIVILIYCIQMPQQRVSTFLAKSITNRAPHINHIKALFLLINSNKRRRGIIHQMWTQHNGILLLCRANVFDFISFCLLRKQSLISRISMYIIEKKTIQRIQNENTKQQIVSKSIWIMLRNANTICVEIN